MEKRCASLSKPKAGGALATERIGQDTPPPELAGEFVTDDPAFGIWRDREDVTDVQAYVRKIRQARYVLKRNIAASG